MLFSSKLPSSVSPGSDLLMERKLDYEACKYCVTRLLFDTGIVGCSISFPTVYRSSLRNHPGHCLNHKKGSYFVFKLFE